MNNTDKSYINKVIAIIAIIALTLSDFLFVGTNFVSYALDVLTTNSENVQFVAYFINNENERVTEVEKNIDEGEKLYIDIAVQREGYFNGTINLNNSNFNFKQQQNSSYISEITPNAVTLKQINVGSVVTLELEIEPKESNKINSMYFDAETEVVLDGNYVNSKNIEKDSLANIRGTTNVKVTWKSSINTNVNLEASLLTNYLYKVEEKEKRIVQILVNSKILNNNYPVKNTQVTLDVPDNVEDVKVHARSTNATNSDIIFGNNNYTYNTQEKKLTISLLNEDTNNINWNKNVQDTFVITYVFDKEVSVANKDIYIQDLINTYDNKELKVEQNVHIEKEIDGIVSYAIEGTEDAIYKGKIYTGEERLYTVKDSVDVNYLNVLNNITIKEDEAKYVADGKEVIANIVYKSTKINKKEFLSIFGEEGYLTVKNSSGAIVANINKNTQTDENGNIVINYVNEEKVIEIISSKPQAVGTLHIESTKAILDTKYSREIIDTLSEIKEKLKVNNFEAEKTIILKNTETSGTLEINNGVISTIEENQEITLVGTLVTDSEDKNLFKNPKVTIILPKEIIVKSAKYAVLYKNGLEVENVSSGEQENGEYKVEINLKGEQQKYDSTGGTKIYLKAIVAADKLTPTKMSEIRMMYTNENTNEEKQVNVGLGFESKQGLMVHNELKSFNSNGDAIYTIDSQEINGRLDAKSGSKNAVLNTSIINNYNQELTDVTLIGILPANIMQINPIVVDNSKVKVYYSKGDDNWTESANNAALYKIVVTQLEKEEVLKLNIPITIKENIEFNTSGMLSTKVKYMYQNEPIEKNSNINLTTANGVTTEESKEPEYVQETENGLKVSVTAMLANKELAEGESIYEGETIKYKVTVTNNTGKDYTNVKVKATQNNGYVWDLCAEEVVNYYYSEDNITEHFYDVSDNDINLGTIETLKNGETYKYEYEALTYTLDDNKIKGNQTYGTISIKTDNKQLNETVKTIENNIEKAELKVKLYEKNAREAKWYGEKAAATILEIENLTDTIQKDVKVKIILMNNLHLGSEDSSLKNIISSFDEKEIVIDGKETNESGQSIVTLTIPYLDAYDSVIIQAVPFISKMESQEAKAEMLAQVESASKVTYNSNYLSRTIYKLAHDIEVKQKIERSTGENIDYSKDLINDGEILVIKGEIVNKENTQIYPYITYQLDNALELQSAKLITQDYTEDITSEFYSNSLVMDDKNIKGNEKMEFVIVAKNNAKNVTDEKISCNLNAMDIQTYMAKNSNISVKAKKIQEKINIKKKNVVKEIVDEPEETSGILVTDADGNVVEETIQNESNPSINTNESTNTKTNTTGNVNENTSMNTNLIHKQHKISGIAWIDKNQNGKREEEEKRAKDIRVVAMDSFTGNIMYETKTGENGEYSLDVKEGSYIVAFYYNTEIYNVTTYQANETEETENSDVITKTFVINKDTITVGATDTININKDINNLDIGLYNKNKFDLKLQKYVSKIVVSNNAGTKTYDLKDKTMLAKAEIEAKDLKDSLVVIEYKIEITNVGDIEGYANNIVDYLPTSLNFSSKLNPDWYKSGEYLYNQSLESTSIKPGETKELTLVVTKKMTETNIGLVNNKAEIISSSNPLGLEDETKDIGSANVIISVSTGALVSYITITMSVFGILCIVVYLIYRKNK